MNIEIKKSLDENVVDIAKLYDKEIIYMDKTNTNYPKWEYGVYPSIEDVIECTKQGILYYVLCDGILSASFILNEEPYGNYEKANFSIKLKQSEYVIIHALVVDHNMAHKGIGTKIVDYSIKKAKELGYKAIRIDVVPTNYPAINLYLKCGFSFVGSYDLERNKKDIPLFNLYEYNL